MDIDAKSFLAALRATDLVPEEAEAIDELLAEPDVVVAPFVMGPSPAWAFPPKGRPHDDHNPVWAFHGGGKTLAVPFDMLPDLTKLARESGALRGYCNVLHAEAAKHLAEIQNALLGVDA